MSDLSTKQAADRLGISVPTVIAWIKNGSLDGKLIVHGKRSVWRCSEASVEKLRRARGKASWNDVEQRIAALEAVITQTPRPGTAKVLRDWIAAEDVAARRRRHVMELLAGSDPSGSHIQPAAQRHL